MNELQSLVIVLLMKLYKLSCILKLINIFGEGDNSDTYSGASKKVGIWPKYKMNNTITDGGVAPQCTFARPT